MKKILITGGAGFIGSVLARKLLERGYSLVILDKFLYVPNSLKEIEFNSRVEIIKADVRDIEKIFEGIKNVDVVIHLAGLVGDSICAINPEITLDINYFTTILIAQVCKKHHINRLIYTSSCSVYGASEEDGLLNETSPLIPVSLYAKTKIESEKKLKELEDPNFKPTILRLGTVFGHSFRPRFDLVVNNFIAKALRDKKITVFGGNQWRPNIHVADVSDAIILALESPIEKVGGETFNVGSEQLNYKIIELAKIVKKEISDCKIIINDNLEDKRNYRVSFKKIKKELGFTTKKNIKDAIIETINAIENEKIDPNDRRYNNLKHLKNNYDLNF